MSRRVANTRVGFFKSARLVKRLAIVLCVGIALFFLICQVEERLLVRDLVSSIDLDDQATVDERVMKTSQAVYKKTNGRMEPDTLSTFERKEAFSPANITTAVSLKYGIYIVEGHPKDGPCGTMSRNLLNALWYQGVRARKLHLNMGDGTGHTMVEYFDEGKWKVIAPSDNSFVWRTSKGEVASAKEIQNDNEIFQQIYSEVPDYAYRFDRVNRFNWERLPSFLQARVSQQFGQKWCDEFEATWIMDQPRLAAAFVFFLVAFISLLAPIILLLGCRWIAYVHLSFGSKEQAQLSRTPIRSDSTSLELK